MAGEQQEREPGARREISLVLIGFVFLLSCGIAAGILAIHESGGFARLFGPRLAEYRPDPPSSATPAEAPTSRGAGAGAAASLGSAAPSEGVSTPSGARPKARALARRAVRRAVASALGTGTLAIRCNRPCRVSVDGKILGEAAPTLRKAIAAGDHQVRVELLDGDDLATRKVIVAPDRTREIAFTLGGKLPVEDFFHDLKGTEDWE